MSTRTLLVLTLTLTVVPVVAQAGPLEIRPTELSDWWTGSGYDYSGLGLFHETDRYGFFDRELVKMKIVDAEDAPRNTYDPDTGELYVEFELYQNTSAPNPDAPPNYTPFDEFVARGKAYTIDPLMASEMPGHPDFVDPGRYPDIAGTLWIELDFTGWDAVNWPDADDFMEGVGWNRRDPNPRTTWDDPILTTTIDVYGYDYGAEGGFNSWSDPDGNGFGTLYIWAANGKPKRDGYKGKYKEWSSDLGIDFKLHTQPIESPSDTSPVPEPGTLTLLGLAGFPFLASMRRRRSA